MKPTYGDVTAEYRALREAAAKVEGAHDLLWVEGPGAVGFLQGILSQDVAAMEPGDVRRSLFLSPQGKLQALLWLLRGEDRVGVVTDAGFGEAVADGLGYYRIRVKAEIRLDERPIIEVWGPEAHARVRVDGARWRESDGMLAADLPLPGLGRVLVAGGPGPEGLPDAGGLAVTAVRVEAGEPVMGRDVDEKTIPQESGVVPEAVSFTKGCYLGQELVARIDSRGHVNRSLRGVVVQTNVLPPEGAALVADDGREVGTVTSVAESLLVGAPVGLALVRREVEAGGAVSVRWDGGEASAVVRDLPLVR